MNQLLESEPNFEECLRRRSILLPEEIRRKIGAYFHSLHCANAITNLTGYLSMEDYVDFHLLDTLTILKFVAPFQGARMMDIGTGAGIPGILIKILRPDLHITMVESQRKKTDFLTSIITELSLEGCKVMQRRAEEVAHDVSHREKYDYAVARAVGTFSLSLELTSGFVRPGGWIVLPRGGVDPILEAREELFALLSCNLEKTIAYPIPRRDREFHLFFIQKTKILLPKYPRKPGQIRKHPL